MQPVLHRALPLALLLTACSSGTPDVAVRDAWAGATVPGQRSGAVYLTLDNRGSGGDRLIGVASDVAAGASLHRSSMESGIARMRPIADGVAVEAGEQAMLKPGADHVMLTGLEQPLVAGRSIPLRLRFERSGERQVSAVVRSADGAGHGRH
jgi:copper(I)-binding protein